MTDETWPHPRFRELTPTLLNSLASDEVGDAIVQHVALQVDALGEENREDIVRRLAPGARAVYTTWLVDIEVNNGGFNQFFFNSYGRFAGAALAGYELLGAENYAMVMRAAIATHEAERQTVAPYYDEHTLESFGESYKHTALGEVDQRYYALGDKIYDVWAHFVRERADLFLH